MDTIDRTPGSGDEKQESPGGCHRLSRRRMLTTTAAALAGISAAEADTVAPATGFGAPLVELHFPAGVLSPEQKATMIKGVSDVLVKATNLAPDQRGKLWVQIFETAESGWGAGGQVFVPHRK